MTLMTSLILASASPRRAQLLEQIGLTFRVQPADINESVLAGEPAEHYVERLARGKAQRVASQNPNCLVLGSDTSVVLNGEVLGKPGSEAEAQAMLLRLSGQTHQVMTAVALAQGEHCQSSLVVTNVRFRVLSESEITTYVASGEPMDKAGGYGIQGLGGIFVSELKGSYSAVVGLPLQETAGLLAEAGHPVWHSWPCSKESQI
ncbi:Maf-like protein [Marinobacter halophilus]|nr:Maf-like protein [Marinobacter halophilus]